MPSPSTIFADRYEIVGEIARGGMADVYLARDSKLSRPVALDGPLISREHVVFEFREGKLTLEDLSVNGSWLNGQALKRGHRYEVTQADILSSVIRGQARNICSNLSLL